MPFNYAFDIKNRLDLDKPGGDITRQSVGMDKKNHSFSGVDINAVLVFPDDNANYRGRKLGITPPYAQRGGSHYRVFAELQTLSVTHATSIWPVRYLGGKSPRRIIKGARSFAGTMVFAMIDKDVFYDVMRARGMRPSVDKYYLDDMPEFDVVINAQNEYGDSAIQIITGVVLSHSGMTYSIDDLYLESTFTWMARHITPFIKSTNIEPHLISSPANQMKRPLPDEEYGFTDFIKQAQDIYKSGIKDREKASQELGSGLAKAIRNSVTRNL